MKRPRSPYAVLAVIVFLLAGANLLFTARDVNQLRGAVLASCHFNADLGTVPVSVNPKTGQASLLGVSIVSDARVAWHRLGCDGRLAAPAPSFVRWARFYKLPLN